MDDRLRVRMITQALLSGAREDFLRRDAAHAATLRRARWALAAGLLLLLGTLLWLLRQFSAAQQGREELAAADARAQERLAELEGVLATVPVAVFIARDPACQRVDGNPAAALLMQAPGGANLSLRPRAEAVHPDLHYRRDGRPIPVDELPLRVAARTGTVVATAQLDLVRGDGSIRHLLTSAHPLLDAAGASRGAVAAHVDVSDVIQAAHELRDALEENRRLLASTRRAELLYRSIARNFPNGAISLFDHDLRFLVFDGTRFVAGGDSASRVGKTLREILPPDVAARVEPAHREALAGREGRVEFELGGRRMEIHSCPVRDETGAVVMGLAMSQDVTEERALRMQLTVSSRLASLGTLVAGVAHEVNNPLAGLIASLGSAIEDLRTLADRLRSADPPDRERLAELAEESVEVLLDAQVGGDRIARIVKDLALFGRPNPMRTRVRLGDVVTSAMRWLPASVGSMATVQVDDLGAPEVHASAGQLEQVVVNLVNNGAMATPPGRRGHVAIRIAPGPDGGAVLEVKDDGRGIDPAHLERIFDPFFTTREVGQGMGLGLPICHAIVTAHGGRLTVESAPGRGSVFRVELPPADAQPEARPVPPGV